METFISVPHHWQLSVKTGGKGKGMGQTLNKAVTAYWTGKKKDYFYISTALIMIKTIACNIWVLTASIKDSISKSSCKEKNVDQL